MRRAGARLAHRSLALAASKPMSIFNALLDLGEQAILSAGHADTITVLTGQFAGQQFSARLDIEPIIDLESDLGSDPRMQTIMRVRPAVCPALLMGDRVASDGANYKIIKREDNRESITTDFWLEQEA